MRFSLLLLSMIFTSFQALAAEWTCIDIFSLNPQTKIPTRRKGGFAPSEQRVLEVFKEVKKIMDINVSNLRSFTNPEADKIVFRLLGHRKPIRSVYTYALTLHPFDWWLEKLDMKLSDVAKVQEKLTETEIFLAIAALKDKGLPLGIDTMRSKDNGEYDTIISQAIGRRSTASKLYRHAISYGKTWTQWTSSLKPSWTAKSREAVLTADTIIAAMIQLNLSGFDLAHTHLSTLKNSKDMQIIYEFTNLALQPGEFYKVTKALYGQHAWRVFRNKAEARAKEAPIHLLIAAFNKPPKQEGKVDTVFSWKLDNLPSDLVLVQIEKDLLTLRRNLNQVEEKVFDQIYNYYSSSNQWNITALETYIRIRIGFEAGQQIENIFALIKNNQKMQSAYYQYLPAITAEAKSPLTPE